jgi:ABC-type multidrug transport system fused ATPase/permease subunit
MSYVQSAPDRQTTDRLSASQVVVVLSLCFLFLSKFLSIKVPFLLKRAIDQLNSPVALMPTALFACYGLARVGAVVTQELKTTIFAYVSQGALRQYALTIFARLHELDSSFHQQHPTGLLSVAYVRGIRGFQTVLFQLVFSVAPTVVEVRPMYHDHVDRPAHKHPAQVLMVSVVLARRCGLQFLAATVMTFLVRMLRATSNLIVTSAA